MRISLASNADKLTNPFGISVRFIVNTSSIDGGIEEFGKNYSQLHFILMCDVLLSDFPSCDKIATENSRNENETFELI